MEKSLTFSTTASGTTTPTANGHRHSPLNYIPRMHRGRLKRFKHANGRHIHVASSPDEADRLRRTLSESSRRRTTPPDIELAHDGYDVDDDATDFDLVIHGSPEHVDALRETRDHHQTRWEAFKEKHADLAAEFEELFHQMDVLAEELHYITEHAVQLDANFSKYGFSAHIRTKDSPTDSRAGSISNGHHGNGTESPTMSEWQSADRKKGIPMKLYQTPIIRQYFHKGLIWRATENQEVASYELFVDLLYVGIIAIGGDAAAEHASGQTLLRFAVTFVLGWKFWLDVTMFVGWFDSDDIVRRLLVLIDLVLLLGYTTNIVECFQDTYAPMVAFYLAARLYSAVYLVWMAIVIPMVRWHLLCNAILTLFPAALWIASIYVPQFANEGLIWPAMMLDHFGHVSLIVFSRRAIRRAKARADAEESGDCPTRDWLDRAFDFIPALNIEHKIERTGAFVTLVFGYSVVALLYQSRVPFGINAFFGKAVLGLIQAFSFNWMYFEVDSFNLHTHAIRRSVISSMLWVTMHLPFIMGFVLSGAALARVVLARDCAHTPLDSLTDVYAARSSEHLPSALRWFYCVGLGVALGCMGIISLTHEYKRIPSVRIRRSHRLALRFIVATILILLPVAGDRLDSLQLVATTTGLVVAVLALDLFGSTCSFERLWGCSRKRGGYVTRCHVSKKELQASVLDGKMVNVEKLMNQENDHGLINMA